MTPPVGKSGTSVNLLPCKCLIDASISSLKLCGSILVDKPTAIPSPPCAKSIGNLTGKWMGSFFRPSYESCHWVTLGLNTTSRANLDSRASMYREAAAESPVRIFPQFPCMSINRSFCPICTMASAIEASPWGWYCMVCPTMLATLL